MIIFMVIVISVDELLLEKNGLQTASLSIIKTIILIWIQLVIYPGASQFSMEYGMLLLVAVSWVINIAFG